MVREYDRSIGESEIALVRRELDHGGSEGCVGPLSITCIAILTASTLVLSILGDSLFHFVCAGVTGLMAVGGTIIAIMSLIEAPRLRQDFDRSKRPSYEATLTANRVRVIEVMANEAWAPRFMGGEDPDFEFWLFDCGDGRSVFIQDAELAASDTSWPSASFEVVRTIDDECLITIHAREPKVSSIQYREFERLRNPVAFVLTQPDSGSIVEGTPTQVFDRLLEASNAETLSQAIPSDVDGGRSSGR